MDIIRVRKILCLSITLLIVSGELFSNDLGKIDSLKEALSSSENIQYRNEISAQLGREFLNKDNQKSVQYSLLAYTYADSINNKELKKNTSYAIAQAYNAMGDYINAMEYFTIANKLSRESKDSLKIVNIENGMGNLYLGNEEYKQALVHYNEAYMLAKAINDPSTIAASIVSLGYVFTSLGNHDSAIVYYQKAIKIFHAVENEVLHAATYTHMATSLLAKDRDNEALVLAKKGLTIMLKLDNQLGIAYAHEILGEIYFKKGVFRQALKEYEHASEMFIEAKAFDNLQRVLKDLSILYEKVGQKEIAYNYLVRHVDLKDSLFNRSKERILAEMEGKYESKLHNHQMELLNKEKRVKEIELEFKEQEEGYIIIALIIISLILSYMTVIFFRNKKLTKKLNISVSEIQLQQALIEEKNSLLTEKNNNILSSIKYAKRIQYSVLPHTENWDDSFDDSFIMYMPKDLVSGDFYWMHKFSDDEVAFAALDCTGHGVPGGFMSLLGYNSMERAINEFDLRSPGKILGVMKIIVNESLQRGFGGENVMDGMDVTMCILNKKTGVLQYAGAHNPLWIMRDGEILETKATKQAVGMFTNNHESFENHTIQLQNEDVIYIFSDGYADQFGGDKGKKIMSKGFKKVLVDFKDLSLKDQKTKLTKYFYNWMNEGEEDQGDDVCIIAVKYNSIKN